MNPLMADLRQIPVRYYALAGTATVLIWLAHRATPATPYAYYVDEVTAFLAALGTLGGVLLALAPLVALRSVPAATVVAAAPMVLVVFGEHRWPFTAFCGLVAVALVGTWRSPRQALLPAGLALGYVAVLVTGATTMVMPYGAEIDIAFRSVLERLLLFGTYVAAVAVLFAAAMWLRAGVLRAQQEAALAARSAEVEEESVVLGERARLARDLHDVVAHHVSLIAVRAETAPYTCPDLQPQARLVLADIAADARSALDELRGVLGVLRRADEDPPVRAPQPTLRDVAELVGRARSTGQTVTVAGDVHAPVGAAAGYVGYRVVQEALTNARRHAPGQPVEVAVDASGGSLRIRVLNPLTSPPDAPGGARRGLAGMRERVEALQGSLVAEVRGGEFVVEADIPKGDE